MTQVISYKSRDGLIDMSRDYDAFPPALQFQLAELGFKHLGGNTIPATVSQFRKKLVEDGVDEDSLNHQVAEYTKSVVAERLAQIDSGALVFRGPGDGTAESTDPLQSEMNKIAKARAMAAWERNVADGKLSGKFPSRRKVDGKMTAETVNLGGQQFTAADLIQRQIDRDPDGIRKEAEKVIRDRERNAERALANTSADDLGL
ncbi:MAG TPA: hypothetical protein VJQ25_11000 [Nitrospira sp.]|nr:hypothetical protein [Nitrospira sp.]